MQEQALFRNAAMGFHKAEVLAYVKKLHEELQLMQQRATADAAQRDAREKELQGMIDELGAKTEALSAQLEEEKEVANTLRSQLGEKELVLIRLKADKDHQQEMLSTLADEYLLKQQAHKELEQKLDDLNQKGITYNDAAFQIGRTLMEANRFAKKIMDDAREQVEVIRAKGIVCADELVSGYKSFRSGLDLSIGGLRGTIQQMETLIGELEQNADDMLEEYSALGDTRRVAKDIKEEAMERPPRQSDIGQTGRVQRTPPEESFGEIIETPTMSVLDFIAAGKEERPVSVPDDVPQGLDDPTAEGDKAAPPAKSVASGGQGDGFLY